MMHKKMTNGRFAAWRYLVPAIALSSVVAVSVAGADSPEFKVNVGDGVCPTGYRLAQLSEVRASPSAACNALGQWYIARLAGGGSQDGPGYACKNRESDSRTLGHSLCVKGDAPLPGALVGKWTWKANGASFGTTTIKPDGTCTTSHSSWNCTWTVTDTATRKVTVKWNDGQWIDSMVLSADGTKMSGSNQKNAKIEAEKQP